MTLGVVFIMSPIDTHTGLSGWARLLSPFDGRLRLATTRRRNVACSRFGAVRPSEWLLGGDPLGTPLWENISAIAFPLTTGTVRPGERRALCAIVRALRPERVLEVGTYLGASTASLALGLASVGRGVLDTVDIRDVNDLRTKPWEAEGMAESPEALLERVGVRDRVTFNCSASLDFLKREERQFDLVFLDGDHEPWAVYAEIASASSRLKPGGHIILHDYFVDGRPIGAAQNFMSGPYQAVRRVLRENPQLSLFPPRLCRGNLRRELTLLRLLYLARLIDGVTK